MSISATVLWFVLALIVAGAEMLTGTVYLLVVAIGCAGGGLASYAGLSPSWQFAVCAVLTLTGAFLVRRFKSKPDDRAEALLKLDSDQIVTVEAVGSDGLAVVQYRGAPWIARPAEGTLSRGTWLIDRVDGAQLILKPIPKS